MAINFFHSTFGFLFARLDWCVFRYSILLNNIVKSFLKTLWNCENTLNWFTGWAHSHAFSVQSIEMTFQHNPHWNIVIKYACFICIPFGFVLQFKLMCNLIMYNNVKIPVFHLDILYAYQYRRKHQKSTTVKIHSVHNWSRMYVCVYLINGILLKNA